MLLWGCILLTLAAAVTSERHDVTIGDKWVPFIPRKQHVGQLTWVLTTEQGSGIKLFCPDFRFPMAGNYEESCQHGSLIIDDGVSKQRFCETQREFLLIGKTSKMTIELSSERIGGYLECLAKSSHPPKSYEEVSLTPGSGIKRIKYPEVRGEDSDKAWRFRSASGNKLSIQCTYRLEGKTDSGKCIKDILTVDTGSGPQQTCSGVNLTEISSGPELTLRLETYPTTDANIDCVVQSITGPNVNEFLNVETPDEDSSEHGVAPGRKKTTCDCGKANKNNERVINGKETHESKYPFMVSLRGANGGGHFCGASILSPVHILTAAHCVSQRSDKHEPVPSELRPVVGAHSGEAASHGETQELRVKKVSIPKEWFAVKGSLAGDIALLHLETPIKFSKWVSPICLTPHDPQVINKFITAMGWGLTEDGYPDKLRETKVQVLDPSLCNDNPKETCLRNSNTTTCYGDSGGPFVYVDPDTNRYTQVALVSYGYGDVCDGRFSIGTNVVYWYDWLQNAMAETSREYGICRKVD